MKESTIIAVLPLLLVATLWWPCRPSLAADPVSMEVWNVTANTNVTLVHNKMNHSVAEEYCRTLGKSMNVKPPLEVASHLISIHSEDSARNLMKWILSREHKRLYIGGVVSKNVRQESVFFTVRWVDKSPDDFHFLHLPNRQLHEMSPEEERCLAIDYTTGRWGVHRCDEELMFLCATVVMDPEAMKEELPMETNVVRSPAAPFPRGRPPHRLAMIREIPI